MSELVLNSIPNDLYSKKLSPPIELEVGFAAIDISDLTSAALTLMNMIRSICKKDDYLHDKEN